MSLCSKNMTPLQRRATQRMGAALLLTVITNFSGSRAVNPLFDVFPALSQVHKTTLLCFWSGYWRLSL